MKTGLQEHYMNTKTYEGHDTSYRGYYGHHKCLAGWRTCSYAPQGNPQYFGRTTYSAMRTWFKQICTNLIAVKNPQDRGRWKGHLCILQAPAVFHARNGELYNPPPNAPPSYPNILPGENTAERECLRAEHKVLYVHWDKYVHTGRITVNIGAAVFNKWVLAAIKYPKEGLNGVTTRDVYDYIMSNYAKYPKPRSTPTLTNSTNQSTPAELSLFTSANKNSARIWRKIHMYQSPRPS